MRLPSSPSDRVVALDVGGANLKAADGRGWSRSTSFPLWQRPEDLTGALRALVADRLPARVVATMTGEIADCFSCRAAGVAHIVAALARAAASPPSELAIYVVDGHHRAGLVPAEEALRRPLDAAASNWHALARLAAQHAPTERSVLIDIGSTTTDIVPLVDRMPAPVARHDADRMLSGELVYLGVERTPLPALSRTLPHRGVARPIAAERFAESRDVWLLLGDLPADADCRETADGGPATVDAARVRLARSMLLDPESFTPSDAVVAARRCAALQARRITRALVAVMDRVGWRPTGVVLSGHGTALARRVIRRTGWLPAVVSLPNVLGADVSRSAPAHALACIARGFLP